MGRSLTHCHLSWSANISTSQAEWPILTLGRMAIFVTTWRHPRNLLNVSTVNKQSHVLVPTRSGKSRNRAWTRPWSGSSPFEPVPMGTMNDIPTCHIYQAKITGFADCVEFVPGVDRVAELWAEFTRPCGLKTTFCKGHWGLSLSLPKQWEASSEGTLFSCLLYLPTHLDPRVSDPVWNFKGAYSIGHISK